MELCSSRDFLVFSAQHENAQEQLELALTWNCIEVAREDIFNMETRLSWQVGTHLGLIFRHFRICGTQRLTLQFSVLRLLRPCWFVHAVTQWTVEVIKYTQWSWHTSSVMFVWLDAFKQDRFAGCRPDSQQIDLAASLASSAGGQADHHWGALYVALRNVTLFCPSAYHTVFTRRTTQCKCRCVAVIVMVMVIVIVIMTILSTRSLCWVFTDI